MPKFSFRNVVQLTKKELDKKKVEANRQLQDNNNALKKGMKSLEDEAKKAKEVVESVAEEVKKGTKEKKALNTSLKSLIAKHSHAESVLIGKTSKYDEISRKVEKLGKAVLDKEKCLNTLTKAIEQANTIKPDIVKLKEELKSVEKETLMQKTGLDDLVNQESILKDRVKGIAKDYENKIKPYIEEIDKVKGNQANLRKKYKDEVITLEKETVEAMSRVAKGKSLLKSVEAQVAASKSLLTDEFDKIKTATDDLKQLERAKALLVREIADRKKSFEGWTIKEAEKVAKKVLKGRMENIDKAGLKESLSAI
jgi:DNA repair exonuclease SbcCD ATPase subunit